MKSFFHKFFTCQYWQDQITISWIFLVVAFYIAVFIVMRKCKKTMPEEPEKAPE